MRHVAFLLMLLQRKLISSSATEILLTWMREVETGRGRLRAGLSNGWSVAHKTGTGPSWRGEVESVSDIGFLFSPHGREIAVGVFIARSTAPFADQERVMAEVAALIAESGSDLPT